MGLRRVLVANRGEIAVRIIAACRALGIESVQACSEPDRHSLPARLADRSVCIGPAKASLSYLDPHALVATALGTGCDGVHPGYGFLSERAEFAELCEANGLVFVGPRGETVRKMGNKLRARAIAAEYGVPLVPGSPEVTSLGQAAEVVDAIGFPVLFKAAAGGGGRGIRIVEDASELESSFRSAANEAQAAFGDGSLYLERYVANARHIEVQVLADTHGNVIHLGERDCSLQRRYQKVVEEAPAPRLQASQRTAIHESAVRLTEAIDYHNAGTVEFVFDEDRREHYFLEMNTRIQVEHPVTEEITGVDLVQRQLQVAAGEELDLAQSDIVPDGHAIECRINAESPARGFQPSPGTLRRWEPPNGPGVRVDTHCYEGYAIPPYYDSMVAKLIVHGRDRADAVRRTRDALEAFVVEGVDTTIPFLTRLMDAADFREGRVTTKWIEEGGSHLVGA